MSGIAGIIHFDGKPVEPGLIEKMTAAMAHRGPDGIHHWTKGNVALGQCMLRTTPESLEEHQPLANEDETLVLVMDGRVDNWEELRRELLGRGARLRSRSDAELVLRAYEVWGDDCLPRIDGDFALVIWDSRRRTAFCARDRMGNKPFNYHWDGKTLTLASELRAILAMEWVPKTVNEGLLAEFLGDEWYTRDETLWKGARRLVPAHRMLVNSLRCHSVPYWKPHADPESERHPDSYYIAAYKDVLVDSVRRLSRSHKPVSFEVSGGHDSSALFGVAAQLSRAGRLQTSGIHAYTLSFDPGSPSDERSYAQQAADHAGLHLLEVKPWTPPLSWFDQEAAFCRDFPGYPNGAMHRPIYQATTSEGGVVAVTGFGGDQILEGSRTYYAEELQSGRWENLWECLRRDTADAGARNSIHWFVRHGAVQSLPASIRSVLRRRSRFGRRHASRNGSWLSPELRRLLQNRRPRAHDEAGGSAVHARQRRLLRTLEEPSLALAAELSERLGSRYAVEVRHPFRTSRVVQFLFTTPERLLLRAYRQKYMHLEAMRDYLPGDILARRSKADFSGVFSGYLDKMKFLLTERIPADRPDWLDPEGIGALYRAYREDPVSSWYNWALWNVYACDSLFQGGPESGL